MGRDTLRGLSREHRTVLQEARRQGFDVTITGGGHIRLIAPGGEHIYAACTASDHRAQANLISRLRRAGLTWPSAAGTPRARETSTR